MSIKFSFIGNTSKSVLCGREKKTKPPKCLLPCKIKSKCHHINAHDCHFGDCPPCTQGKKINSSHFKTVVLTYF